MLFPAATLYLMHRHATHLGARRHRARHPAGDRAGVPAHRGRYAAQRTRQPARPLGRPAPARSTEMAKLRHLAITVPDPEKAAEFYIQAFGLKRVGTTDWEGAQGVYLTDGVMNLALLHYKKEHYAGKLGREFVGVHHF